MVGRRDCLLKMVPFQVANSFIFRGVILSLLFVFLGSKFVIDIPHISQGNHMFWYGFFRSLRFACQYLLRLYPMLDSRNFACAVVSRSSGNTTGCSVLKSCSIAQGLPKPCSQSENNHHVIMIHCYNVLAGPNPSQMLHVGNIYPAIPP